MTGFRVDLGALELLVERMSAVEAALAEVHDDVESRMRRLGVVWSGRAAAEHQLAYEHWSRGSAEARAALLRLREIARTAGGNYGAAVTANRAMWAR
ncbi:WXG100 family type VII secretion target [Jatrophihabitans endophyticus]|uniref:WXG100 family type VII secretion target n=1 Tax=Jatrophihabitans endophyticus TaxID=1206085 RepID=UPI0019FE09EA|nr:WXG100 family type VII secretion target [Jatrophihabitans endophyticus]MBE7189099.1 WXG100 family type VII secretion target [Jatrophihabitans endophyticus]